MVRTYNIMPSDDTYIDSSKPGRNFSDYMVSWLGAKNLLTEYRYLLRFDIECLPKYAEVLSCCLRLYVDFAGSSVTVSSITPYMIASDWDSSRVNWYTQPDIYEDIYSQSTPVKGIGWYKWDITSLFEKWYTGELCNYGILLKDNLPQSNSDKRVVSSRNRKSTQIFLRPYMNLNLRFPDCHEDVFISGRSFTEQSVSMQTEDEYRHSPGFNTSQQSNATFFIKNTGAFPAEVYIEISPNNMDFIPDGPVYEVAPGDIAALVPRLFSKYTHIACRSKHPGTSTSLQITMQGQV